MEEDIKELIYKIIIIGIVFLVVGFLVNLSFNASNKYNRQRQQKNIQEINECFKKTNDMNWCLNKFLN